MAPSSYGPSHWQSPHIWKGISSSQLLPGKRKTILDCVSNILPFQGSRLRDLSHSANGIQHTPGAWRLLRTKEPWGPLLLQRMCGTADRLIWLSAFSPREKEKKGAYVQHFSCSRVCWKNWPLPHLSQSMDWMPYALDAWELML